MDVTEEQKLREKIDQKVGDIHRMADALKTDMEAEIERLKANETAQALRNLTTAIDRVEQRLTALEEKLPEEE